MRRTGRAARAITLALAAVMVAVVAAAAYGQQAVPVGKGSYASDPPTADGNPKGFDSRTLNVVGQPDRPIPTNQWWTRVLFDKFARALWCPPFRFDTSEKGLAIILPTKFTNNGGELVAEFPMTVGGKDFRPADCRAKDWSDWGLVMQLAESPTRYFNATVVKGSPYVWLEYAGIQPQVGFDRLADAKFFDKTGAAVTLPATTDCLGVEYHERCFGLFGPDGTTFALDKDRAAVTFSGKGQYLVVAALPSRKDLETLYAHAFAVPRDTKLSWTYDAAKGEVVTNWKVTTEVLKGSEKQAMLGWIAHHWRTTTNDIAFNKIEYISPRGPIRCAMGNDVTIAYKFSGIVPNLPMPADMTGKNPFDPKRMTEYLQALAAKPDYGEETYWGGKDILRMGQDALMAQQMDDAELQGKFTDNLRTALADWFTYTPGEAAHYFTYYPHFKALVGIKPSYGSEAFNDQHFHYGYLTFASAMLGAGPEVPGGLRRDGPPGGQGIRQLGPRGQAVRIPQDL